MSNFEKIFPKSQCKSKLQQRAEDRRLSTLREGYLAALKWASEQREICSDNVSVISANTIQAEIMELADVLDSSKQ